MKPINTKNNNIVQGVGSQSPKQQNRRKKDEDGAKMKSFRINEWRKLEERMNDLGFGQNNADDPMSLWSSIIGVDGKESTMVNCIDNDDIKFMEFKFLSTGVEEYHYKIKFLSLEKFKENRPQEMLIGKNGIFPVILDFSTFLTDRAIELLQRNGVCPRD